MGLSVTTTGEPLPLRLPPRAWVSNHPLLCYVVLACLLSWWWVPMAVGGVKTRPGQGWPTHLPGLAGAAIAAIIVTALTQGTAGLRDLAARTFR